MKSLSEMFREAKMTLEPDPPAITVAALIELLCGLPPDAPVVLEGCDYTGDCHGAELCKKAASNGGGEYVLLNRLR